MVDGASGSCVVQSGRDARKGWPWMGNEDSRSTVTGEHTEGGDRCPHGVGVGLE